MENKKELIKNILDNTPDTKLEYLAKVLSGLAANLNNEIINRKEKANIISDCPWYDEDKCIDADTIVKEFIDYINNNFKYISLRAFYSECFAIKEYIINNFGDPNSTKEIIVLKLLNDFYYFLKQIDSLDFDTFMNYYYSYNYRLNNNYNNKNEIFTHYKDVITIDKIRTLFLLFDFYYHYEDITIETCFDNKNNMICFRRKYEQ